MCTTTFRRGVWGVGYALLAVFASHSASGQVLHESAKLLASDGAAGDSFGYSVSVSGDTAVVGAPFDGCAAGIACGSAYLFRFNGTSWVEEQKLTASDAAAGDQFGFSVSASGDTIMVGAHWDDCPGGVNCGSAYMFRYDPTQLMCGEWWCEEQKLTASDGADHDEFGHFSVSVSGDTAVAGAWQNDCPAGNDCGSAYVFRFNGTSWVEEQKLTASDAAAGDRFGRAAAVSGDTALVSAFLDECASGGDCGSAYVFRYDPTQQMCGGWWCEEQKLTASDGAMNDRFGESVSLSGDTALVGADLDDCAAGIDCGSAYVFRFDGGSWVEEQKLTASDAGANNQFGWTVSVRGDMAVVGSPDDNCAAGASCGSVYVYRFNGTNWVEEQKLTPTDAGVGDDFGFSVSVSGDSVVVGAYLDDDAGSDSGSAYVFNVIGTCCISNGSCEAAGNCRENITPSACQALGGRFFGPNLSCAEVCANGACIPTVSTWGIVVLLLLLTTAGTIVLARGRVPAG